jgi:hypothetical protein
MNKWIALSCLLLTAGVQASGDVKCEQRDTKEVRVVKSDAHNLGPGSGGTGGDEQECEPTKPTN